MNEVFDIKRLWKLMQYEVVNYIPNFFKSLLIFSSVIAATWIFSLTVDFAVLPEGRDKLVATLFTLAVILSPFIVYKDMNNRKKGYIYAMIPASTLEKLLSMVVLCVVVVPVLSYAMLTATDLLLWLFTKIGMGSFYSMEFYNPFTETFAPQVYDDVKFTAQYENMKENATQLLAYIHTEQKESLFRPIAFEEKIGMGGRVPPLRVASDNGKAI